MEVRDVRRMATTVLVAGAALLAWLLALWGHAHGRWSWPVAGRALAAMPLAGWLWLGAVVLVVFVFLLGALVYWVDVLPPGWSRGSVRQVQCDHCKAVFFINDTGHRPLTHQCPNCKHLGIYQGADEALGTAHKTLGRRDVIKLALRCRHCQMRFEVTDSGVRPMRVECPHCHQVGRLR